MQTAIGRKRDAGICSGGMAESLGQDGKIVGINNTLFRYFMKKITFVLICGMLAASVSFAQKRKEMTVPATVGYCLPKVSYQVKVKAESVRYIPGPYAEYAEKKLGMKPEFTAVKEQWEIKSVQITPFFVPDEKAVYTMTATGDYTPVMLSLSPEGFLAGVSAGPLAMKAEPEEMEYRTPEYVRQREIRMAELRTYNSLKEVLDSNYVMQEIDGVMKRIWDPIVRYEPKSGKEQLSEAVKEIFRIRSERSKLLSGENEVPDGISLQVMLKEFDQMERDYLSLFMGKKVVQSVERVFMCTIEKENEAVVAFRFSGADGFVDKKNVSAMAYSLVAERAVVPVTKDAQAELPHSVIHYRVPAMADVKFMRVNEELQRFRDVVPQLGVIRKFPADVIGGENLRLEFYPEYGSIKSINKLAR